MIAKARKIIVNNELFYYKVSGSIRITILQGTTGKRIQKFYDCKTKWDIKFTPADIKNLIENNFKFNENIIKNKNEKSKTQKSGRLDHNRS